MRRSRRGDRGQVAGIEVLPFGLLIFIAGGLLLVNIWGVVDAKFAVDAAARNAVRHVVESAQADVSTATLADEARTVALETLDDHGREQPATVRLDSPGGTLNRCQRATVTVTTHLPAIRLPFIGGFGRGFTVTSSHSEIVDPTRAGVGGRAGCIQ